MINTVFGKKRKRKKGTHRPGEGWSLQRVLPRPLRRAFEQSENRWKQEAH